MSLEVKRIGSNTSSAGFWGKLLELSESWLFSSLINVHALSASLGWREGPTEQRISSPSPTLLYPPSHGTGTASDGKSAALKGSVTCPSRELEFEPV